MRNKKGSRESGPQIPHRNLPLLLLRARESVMARFRPIMNAHGITEQQWRILRLLLEAGPLEPREITARCQISSPSLVGILVRMEKDRLVTRERFKRDRRRVLVSLAPRAHKLAESMAPEVDATYRDLQRLLGADFHSRLYETLDQLLTVIERDGSRARAGE